MTGENCPRNNKLGVYKQQGAYGKQRQAVFAEVFYQCGRENQKRAQHKQGIFLENINRSGQKGLDKALLLMLRVHKKIGKVIKNPGNICTGKNKKEQINRNNQCHVKQGQAADPPEIAKIKGRAPPFFQSSPCRRKGDKQKVYRCHKGGTKGQKNPQQGKQAGGYCGIADRCIGQPIKLAAQKKTGHQTYGGIGKRHIIQRRKQNQVEKNQVAAITGLTRAFRRFAYDALAHKQAAQPPEKAVCIPEDHQNTFVIRRKEPEKSIEREQDNAEVLGAVPFVGDQGITLKKPLGKTDQKGFILKTITVFCPPKQEDHGQKGGKNKEGLPYTGCSIHFHPPINS